MSSALEAPEDDGVKRRNHIKAVPIHFPVSKPRLVGVRAVKTPDHWTEATVAEDSSNHFQWLWETVLGARNSGFGPRDDKGSTTGHSPQTASFQRSTLTTHRTYETRNY